MRVMKPETIGFPATFLSPPVNHRHCQGRRTGPAKHKDGDPALRRQVKIICNYSRHCHRFGHDAVITAAMGRPIGRAVPAIGARRQPRFAGASSHNNIYIRPQLGHHCGVRFLGKGAAITCETCLALMAQPRPRC